MGIEDRYKAVILDLDGVITRTAEVHARAWKRMFDEYLEFRRSHGQAPFEPFVLEKDYPEYVDGKPRLEGIRSFLASRGIELPKGRPEDDLASQTLLGLGNRKNGMFLEIIRSDGVGIYEDSVEQIKRWRSRGLRTAIVSSSKNCREILESVGLLDLFEVRVDGVVREQLGLTGKPAPDIFVRAAEELGVLPSESVVVEDAKSGVQAGRAGGFGLVVGVDRTGRRHRLLNKYADVVLTDARKLNDDNELTRNSTTLPSALAEGLELAEHLKEKRPAVFLDYDGTLTPIVKRPELATLSDTMRGTLKELASRCQVAIVSGRDRKDVKQLVGLDDLVYAGSHGFDIEGPGLQMDHEEARGFLPVLDKVERELNARLETVTGCLIERKRFSIAVHYRLVDEAEVDGVEAVVNDILGECTSLRKGLGKKVFELRPGIDWDKGKAVFWLLEALDLDHDGVLPIYIGDDVTDEDAFRALSGRGIGIVVAESDRPTHAHYTLGSTDEVGQLLHELNRLLLGRSS